PPWPFPPAPLPPGPAPPGPPPPSAPPPPFSPPPPPPPFSPPPPPFVPPPLLQPRPVLVALGCELPQPESSPAARVAASRVRRERGDVELIVMKNTRGLEE